MKHVHIVRGKCVIAF